MSHAAGTAGFSGLAPSSSINVGGGAGLRRNGGHGGTGGNPLYAAAARIPLIKSPSVSVPPPIRLPADLHPLPPDIRAYFVYPFSLESYVLDANTPSSSTIEELQKRYDDYLRMRQEEKEAEKREVLRRMAPGWAEGGGGIMVPDSTRNKIEPQTTPGTGHQEGQRQAQQERAPIDDLVDHLAKLEAMGAKPVGDSTGRS
ncbi:uncharacterized protein PFL1_04415 [Pseudozyma flocculosa PF-1]|uniref:Uncharacterized protein n=2 Tax=Pseudozyma flocculosa TaxID=84751 RepID=A0A5C3FBR3_9BASI|nr:uncharacterized protein PFL1_04415 [Pseudozyma flocculosa PF-1]EPQ28088.1 hypothetical protein PFL1_04415 [Pseudozyma flocculosa PF-1]SPO41884.1 uncharacterized protein PSFLO_07366 [Pseudozyma flocculosa]